LSARKTTNLRARSWAPSQRTSFASSSEANRSSAPASIPSVARQSDDVSTAVEPSAEVLVEGISEPLELDSGLRRDKRDRPAESERRDALAVRFAEETTHHPAGEPLHHHLRVPAAKRLEAGSGEGERGRSPAPRRLSRSAGHP
jgi:hypothetical protein